MKNGAQKTTAVILTGGICLLAGWFASGLPRANQLRALSQVPGFIVYADETASSDIYRSCTSAISSSPLPTAAKNYLFQYCESKTRHIVLRGLHPIITAEQVRKLEGLEIINFLDIQTGDDADEIAHLITEKAPNLRILHFQGNLSENGVRTICRGLPDLEELFLADAVLENAVSEFENGLLNLQGLTLSNCTVGLGFEETLERRPDVKIAIQ